MQCARVVIIIQCDASLKTDLQSTVPKSCLGAKDTTQTLLETLVSLLKKHCCHKSAVDAWDVLQCNKAVAIGADFTKAQTSTTTS